jgi:hypothetical protein
MAERKPILERYTIDKNGCWIWQGARTRDGRYGQIRIQDKVWRVHRYFYTMLVGPVPDGPTLNHLCGVSLCVNPAHLEVQTEHPVPPKSHRAPILERYAVDKNGCWIWQGGRADGRSGQVRIGKQRWLAHRYFYTAHVGPIPDGLTVHHLCRNPMCVNPAHLEVVLMEENLRRENDCRICRYRPT